MDKVGLLENSLKEEKIPYYKISGEIKTVFSKKFSVQHTLLTSL